MALGGLVGRGGGGGGDGHSGLLRLVARDLEEAEQVQGVLPVAVLGISFEQLIRQEVWVAAVVCCNRGRGGGGGGGEGRVVVALVSHMSASSCGSVERCMILLHLPLFLLSSWAHMS